MLNHCCARTAVIDVREAWLVLYAYDGICRIEETLAAHAAFEEYLSIRSEEGGRDGNVDPGD